MIIAWLLTYVWLMQCCLVWSPTVLKSRMDWPQTIVFHQLLSLVSLSSWSNDKSVHDVMLSVYLILGLCWTLDPGTVPRIISISMQSSLFQSTYPKIWKFPLLDWCHIDMHTIGIQEQWLRNQKLVLCQKQQTKHFWLMFTWINLDLSDGHMSVFERFLKCAL